MKHVGDELEKTQEAMKCGLYDTTACSAIGKRTKMQMSLSWFSVHPQHAKMSVGGSNPALGTDQSAEINFRSTFI